MSANFEAELTAFSRKLDRLLQNTFIRATEEVQESIVHGSPLTGAPGQPVDTSALRNSWIATRLGRLDWKIETGLKYARAMEDGVTWYGPITLRSEVGGFHSVKLTRAAWQKIVEHAVRQVREV